MLLLVMLLMITVGLGFFRVGLMGLMVRGDCCLQSGVVSC